jgi:hypothetical protein
LQPQIRPTLVARVDERLLVESDQYENRSIYPDVTVIQKFPNAARLAAQSATGVAEPLKVSFPDDPRYDGYVQIIDPANGNKVITVIEFLSISNKFGDGADQYREKQKESIKAYVSIVEIDLLREGKWVLAAEESIIPIPKRKPYRACVRRSWEGGQLDYYHFPIRERLPKIRIPLREHDADAIMDLQDLIDRIYVNGAYDTIDYSVQPIPPLDAETAAWAMELVSQRESK